jgi:hypothetical protein
MRPGSGPGLTIAAPWFRHSLWWVGRVMCKLFSWQLSLGGAPLIDETIGRTVGQVRRHLTARSTHTVLVSGL